MDNVQFLHVRTKVLRWSQQRLADELGMARNSVTRMETGVMPIERRTELSMRWLMYSECNVVEQSSGPVNFQANDPVSCNIELHSATSVTSQPSSAAPVAHDPLHVVLFTADSLLSDISPAQVDEVFSKFVDVAEEFDLLQNVEFIKRYIESGFKTWFNRRAGRALARQFLGLPF
jgi:transcriptional regulator with XRE-family HTH domain